MANVTPNNSQIQKIIVAKTGVNIGTRKRINFLEGSNVTINAVDNSGTDTVDITFTGAAAPVSSVFGRTGIVISQSGDYNTTQVTEGSSLYYTQSRFDDAFSAKTTSDLPEGSNLYFTNERVDDRVSSLLVAGTNITLVYNDTLNTLTISASGSGGGGTWGSITGTLSDQTDLQIVLSTKIDSLVAIGGSPNANGATITGSILKLEPANVSNGGVLTSVYQEIGGIKNFSSGLRLDGEISNAVLFTDSLKSVETVSTLRYDKDDRLFSVNAINADATATFGPHTATVNDQSYLTATYEFVTNGYNYTNGMSSYSYEVRAAKTINSTQFYSTGVATTSITESTDLDAVSLGMNFVYGSGAYVASGNNYNYYVYTLYDGGAVSSPNPQSVNATDNNSANNFTTDITWTIPSGSGTTISGFRIYNQFNNTSIDVSSSTNTVNDDGTWGSFPGLPASGLSRYVLNTNSNSTADAWLFTNTSTGKYDSYGAPDAVDVNTFSNTSPAPSTPTSYVRKSLKSEGSSQICGAPSDELGFFGINGVTQRTGDVATGLIALGLFDASASYSSTSVGGLSSSYVVFGSNAGTLAQSSNVLINTSTSRVSIFAGNSPSAKLHLGGGSTSASSAGLKLSTGSLMTTPETGALEFLADALYFTPTNNAAARRFPIASDNNPIGMDVFT